MPDINSDIQYLKGVGPAYAKKFAKLGIYTIRDLLLHYPRRYIDYSQPYTVVSAPFDVDCCVKATVLQRDPDRRIKGGRMLSHVLAGDDTGMLALSWFNAPLCGGKAGTWNRILFRGPRWRHDDPAGNPAPACAHRKPRLLRRPCCRFTEAPKGCPPPA